MQVIGKNTKIDISGHMATVVRIDKGGVVCQLEGEERREVVLDFKKIETALKDDQNEH